MTEPDEQVPVLGVRGAAGADIVRRLLSRIAADGVAAPVYGF